MVAEYDRRRRLIVDGLNTIGLNTFEPRGAFYAFPYVGGTGLDEETFANRLLAAGARGGGARFGLWQGRRGLCALLLRHRLRQARRSARPHRALCQEVCKYEIELLLPDIASQISVSSYRFKCSSKRLQIDPRGEIQAERGDRNQLVEEQRCRYRYPGSTSSGDTCGRPSI